MKAAHVYILITLAAAPSRRAPGDRWVRYELQPVEASIEADFDVRPEVSPNPSIESLCDPAAIDLSTSVWILRPSTSSTAVCTVAGSFIVRSSVAVLRSGLG